MGVAISQADRMASVRAKRRDLLIPTDKINWDRRKACEADDCLWLKTYLPSVFYSPFTNHQERIIEDCGHALRYKVKKCKAAPRGDGKSSIVKYLAMKYAMTRQVRFPLILGATSKKASDILKSIKARLASKAKTPLAEDYPLECHVARYVHGWPSRCRNVTANGQKPIGVEWAADQLILPTWEEEEPVGPIIKSLGYTSDDLQGCNVYDIRPDFVMIDDLDSRDSLAAEHGLMAGKIEEVIDKTVAGLGGQSRGLGMFMLCTITSRGAAAFKYSDPAVKPAWSGERIPAIEKWPNRKDLWDEYCALRKEGKSTLVDGKPVDPFGREAHKFYLTNREIMDDGAVLSNPYNFERNKLPDGSDVQVSSLQRCYDYIADENMESFLTEHQNDPPEETDSDSLGLTQPIIESRISGFEHRQMPAGTTKLVAAIDLGMYECHWCVTAWQPGFVGLVVDYGIQAVRGTQRGDSSEIVGQALINALYEWRGYILDSPYHMPGGEIRHVDLALVDSGTWTDSVYQFVRETGNQLFRAAKGVSPYRTGKSKKVGFHWHANPVPKQRILLHDLDTDWWKLHVHSAFLTGTHDDEGAFRTGSLSLFQSEARNEHGDFAKHILAERFNQEKRKWESATGGKKARDNHWLDALYMSCAAASMEGLNLFKTAGKRKKRVPLSEMGK